MPFGKGGHFAVLRHCTLALHQVGGSGGGARVAKILAPVASNSEAGIGIYIARGHIGYIEYLPVVIAVVGIRRYGKAQSPRFETSEAIPVRIDVGERGVGTLGIRHFLTSAKVHAGLRKTGSATNRECCLRVLPRGVAGGLCIKVTPKQNGKGQENEYAK